MIIGNSAWHISAIIVVCYSGSTKIYLIRWFVQTDTNIILIQLCSEAGSGGKRTSENNKHWTKTEFVCTCFVFGGKWTMDENKIAFLEECNFAPVNCKSVSGGRGGDGGGVWVRLHVCVSVRYPRLWTIQIRFRLPSSRPRHHEYYIIIMIIFFFFFVFYRFVLMRVPTYGHTHAHTPFYTA